MSTEDSATTSSKSNLTTQGSIVAAMTLLSRLSGFARDIVLSYLFGASQLADMFFVALRIPNFFRRLFAEGAFNQAFVPVLMRFKKQGLAPLLAFVAPLSGLFATVLVLVVVLGVLFAPALTALFAPGFTRNAAVFNQTADLVRITFPYLGFISLTAYAGAVLNAHNRFALPAFTPVLLNFCLISAAGLVLMDAGPSGVNGVELVSWGVLVAGVLQLSFLIPPLARLGLLPMPNLQTRHSGVRQVGKLLVPAVLSASVGQINALVNTILASTLMTGSISWLYYADRLMELPLGLVAVALGTVMLPHLSRLAAIDDKEGFKATMDWGIHLSLLIGLPAAVALYLLAQPLSATVFMSFSNGAMTLADIQMIGLALEFFAIALPGFILVKVLAPGFFAHEDTQSPFRYASAAVAVNLAGSLATFSWFGHVGLALATALSAWTHVLLLYMGLRRQGHYRVSPGFLQQMWPVLVASTLLGLVIWWWLQPIGWLSMEPTKRFVGILLTVGGCAVGYGLLLWVFGLRPRHLIHRV